MDNKLRLFKSQPGLAKKFYLLEYFYIVLKSFDKYSSKTQAFEEFRVLKDKFQLGESKYKKLTLDESISFSPQQLNRYHYTFDQVLIEAINYDLIRETKSHYTISEKGRYALGEFVKSNLHFYNYLLKLMESHTYAFYELVSLCYKENKNKNGLMIFPVYSPLKLGFEKPKMTTNSHILDYIKSLTIRLQDDIVKYLSKRKSLREAEEKLISELTNLSLIGLDKNDKFEHNKFNETITKIRNYWLNYFLKQIYKYEYSFDTFNIWVERAKQIGIIHTSDFFPGVSGRIVYPTSIIINKIRSNDFVCAFDYPNDEKLYIHKPNWNKEENQDQFVKLLSEAYYDIKTIQRSHFVSLPDIREKVCYRMRIASYIFNDFLEKAYLMSLKGSTRVQIALEADRLPYETNAMYLKREPVLVNGKYKNIIAIDFSR
ncbi:hypothetical protein [uncultured Pontibacter sp.]|uniref:hypothetical protein n=1 Tax=uncultured Pontibacter sp. TaxID=453356 RepID=UPI00262FCCDF|nr:hypothetical protein [uncultured Pontibacter sp.]